jgi:hypothetical protein
VRFEVEAGKAYFLKSSINKILTPSASGIDVIALTDLETGLQEIRNCRLSSDTPANQSSVH